LIYDKRIIDYVRKKYTDTWKNVSKRNISSCNIVFPGGALPIHLLRHFCWRMYRIATVHSDTDMQMDRQTDRQTTLSFIIIPTVDYTACSTVG